jgi:hypothetical protein
MDAESAGAYPLCAVSGVGVIGLLWAVAGILVGIRWWRERTAGVPFAAAGATRAAPPATVRVRFGQLAEDRSPQRWQAMRLAYAVGAWLVALGLATEVVPALALGAVALNLGTVFRYLVVALDREALDLPLLDLERSARALFGDVIDQPAV